MAHCLRHGDRGASRQHMLCAGGVVFQWGAHQVVRIILSPLRLNQRLHLLGTYAEGGGCD